MGAREAEGALTVPDGSRLQVPVDWVAHRGSQSLFLSCPVPEPLYTGTRGPGKGLTDDTQVLTDSGWKRAADVTMLDRLVSLDGTYTEILGVYPQPVGKLYRVTFDDGATVECDGPHRWSVRSDSNNLDSCWVVRTTDQLADLLIRSKQRWSTPTMTHPAPGRKWCGLDPYALGLMLGDGTTGSQYATLYSVDDELIEHMTEGYGWARYKYDSSVCARAVAPSAQSDRWKDAVGRHKGASKRVPQALLEADPASRLAVLQGLMDSDGCAATDGGCSFSSISENLARSVQYIARSLGGKASCNFYERNKENDYSWGSGGRWRVRITHCNKFNPFRLERKASRVKEQQGVNRRIVSIDRIKDGRATCFAVDHPSQLFVVQDFVVTHNTVALLLKFAKYTGLGFGPAWRGVIFRETYRQLSDLVAKSKALFYTGFSGVRFVDAPSYVWKWPTGEELLLRNMPTPDAYWDYHGHEYPFVGWEELTNWRTLEAYEMMKACNRSSFISPPGVPEMPRIYASTCNPFGKGHSAVKAYFIDPAPNGEVIVDDQSPQGRVAIKGYLRENTTMLRADPHYEQKLTSITDANRRKAWLDGDWDIEVGSMFDDLWSTDVHVVEPFTIPSDWKIERAFDWGSSKPFSVGWWARATGSPATMADGSERHFARGSYIRIGEWYGWNGEPNKGLRMTAVTIAGGIKQREINMGIAGRVRPGPADSSIWDVEDGKCIATEFESCQIRWERAHKGPGSRKQGWERLRQLLENAQLGDEEEGLFVFSTCSQFRRTFPCLPRDDKDPDDADSEAEDHVADEARYEVLRKPLPPVTESSMF